MSNWLFIEQLSRPLSNYLIQYPVTDVYPYLDPFASSSCPTDDMSPITTAAALRARTSLPTPTTIKKPPPLGAAF